MNFRKYYLLDITDHNVHYIGKSIVSPLLMKGLTTLVISMSTKYLHLNSHSIGMTEVLQCEGGLF